MRKRERKSCIVCAFFPFCVFLPLLERLHQIPISVPDIEQRFFECAIRLLLQFKALHSFAHLIDVLCDDERLIFLRWNQNVLSAFDASVFHVVHLLNHFHCEKALEKRLCVQTNQARCISAKFQPSCRDCSPCA